MILNEESYNKIFDTLKKQLTHDTFIGKLIKESMPIPSVLDNIVHEYHFPSVSGLHFFKQTHKKIAPSTTDSKQNQCGIL
jgi:hypothetical protein